MVIVRADAVDLPIKGESGTSGITFPAKEWQR